MPSASPLLVEPTAQSSSAPAQISGYRPELDVVRFFAFLLVFLHHTSHDVIAFNKNGPLHTFLGPPGWAIFNSTSDACGMGLCLFFCLSAYLITELLLREREKTNTVSIRNFYVRRILRIWPLYVFGLLLGVAWGAIDHRAEWSRLGWYLLFAGNVYCGRYGWSPNPLTPLWSISIEEQFYLIWPWAMRWLSRRGLFFCALIFILTANITLFTLGQRHASTDTSVWTNTFIQFQMFAAGILLALAPKRFSNAVNSMGLLLVLTGPVLWFIACYTFHAKQLSGGGAVSGLSLMIGFALIALGCASFLHGFCILGPSHMPQWAIGLGKISYGLYVYHLSAIRLSATLLFILHFNHPLELAGPPAFVLTILIAKLSYAKLEAPFLRLKRRFETVHSRPI